MPFEKFEVYLFLDEKTEILSFIQITDPKYEINLSKFMHYSGKM